MKKLLTITSLIFIVAFVFPVNLFAQDLTLTNDGKVPGKPFEVLQQQIDTLQQQIDFLNENYPVRAYTNSSYLEESFPVGETKDIISLELPEGNYIMTITMGATLFRKNPDTNQSYYDDEIRSYIECAFVDNDGNAITGYGFGGGIVGHESLAQTLPMQFFSLGPHNITLSCTHDFFNFPEDQADLTINSVVWNAIKVDDLDNQVSND